MRRLWLIFSQAVTVAVAVVFVLSTLKPDWLPSSAGRPNVLVASSVSAAAGGGGSAVSPNSYAVAARRAAPSVVSVVASKTPTRNPHRNDPWFRRYFGDGEEPVTGMGSAVIVSADGYLLTNNHVIEQADEIEIVLADGKHVGAKLVGADPDSDLAVLKVEATALPAIVFGDQLAPQVGDVVLAIGNPFNVGQTVTSGIISAIGRTGLGLNTFEDFIQTDAAINPGNSGGALVDINGRLMGINTAIYSRSGGSMGIGFAIPTSTARSVMEAIVRDGQVTRGWIGVEPQDLTPELAESFGLGQNGGVIITGVLQNGPASVAGIRPGDVITQVGDRTVTNVPQLLSAVAALPPGKPATVVLLRKAGSQTVEVVPGRRTPQRLQSQAR